MAAKGGKMAVPGEHDSGSRPPGSGETGRPPGSGDAGRAAESEDRTEQVVQYSEAVDPWATAEADAIAKDGHVPFHLADPQSPAHPHSTWTIPGAEPGAIPGAGAMPGPGAVPGAGPGALPRTKPGADTLPRTVKRVLRPYRKGVWTTIAAGAIALGVTATVLLWPDFPALDFHPLDRESRYDPVVTISSIWSDAEVIGDRAYFASADANGALGVVAVDTESRDEVWRTTVSEPGVTGWDQMVATPGGVVLYSNLSSATSKIMMVVLDGKDGGKRLWDRPIGSSDVVHLGAENALLLDKEESRLLWLDLRTGDVTHEQNDPGSSAIVPVTTPDDLTGPAGLFGRALNPRLDDDARVVQVNSDNSVNVLDVDSGKVLKSRTSVTSPGSDALAHDGRLFVEETTGPADRVSAYTLDGLGEPVTLYTAPESSSLSTFSPCGVQRMCFVETDGFDRKKDRVVAVDAVKGGKVWDLPLPEVEALAPVGDSLLATTSAGTDDVTLIDAGGKAAWTTTGRAARLNGGNILRFADPLTSSLGNRTLSGVHLGDAPVAMGEVRDVYSAGCSWNTTVLACVGEKQFLLYRFAD
ncbi:PQQ-binding-like beta-propeller repeat protein [Actinoplanes sp. GCM10030250]|uniref:outer membrane protein assembly factor BamB family protein n=1 Tax=Actinoplanes sp. GCM10030250 TaxID=3273376 RepID=UPI00361C6218